MRFKSPLITAVLLALVTVAAILLYRKYYVAPIINKNNLQLEDLTGNSIRIDLISYPRMEVYFGTWCPPCMQELPILEELYGNFGSKIAFVAIADPQSKHNLATLVGKHNFKMPIYQSMSPFSELEIFAVPAIYIYDKNRKLTFKSINKLIAKEDLEIELKKVAE